MNRPQRPLATLALVALLSLITAGCGADEPSDAQGTTSSKTTSKANSTKTNHGDTARGKAVKFAECMRNEGVDAFPDPNSSGELTLDGAVNGSSLDPESAVWTTAMSACADLQPEGFTGKRRSSTQQDAALKFARCMRENGVKDFPDPAAGEALINTDRIPSSNRDGGMATLDAAMKACSSYAAAMGVTSQ